MAHANGAGRPPPPSRPWRHDRFRPPAKNYFYRLYRPPSPLPGIPITFRTMRLLFTDLDGTCVHYLEPPTEDWGSLGAPGADGLLHSTSLDGRSATKLLRLPPSASGAQGLISAQSLRLYAALRQLGVRLVIITGARSTTLLSRLPYIPAADAYVCEGGGRIFYPAGASAAPAALAGTSASLPTAAPLVEDLEWRAHQAPAAGPAGQEALPPEDRTGPLWELYARLAAAAPAAGIKLDAISYSTAFRVRGPPAALAAALKELPAGLATALNLGAADVFPATSGKESAARHLMRRFGAQPVECAFMCDDDNDLGLARAVGRAYLPGITAASVAAAVAADPSQFYVSEARGPFGTEEILRMLVEKEMAEGAASRGAAAAGMGGNGAGGNGAGAVAGGAVA